MAQQILFGMSKTNVTQLLLLLQVGMVEVVALQACVSTFFVLWLELTSCKVCEICESLMASGCPKA